ncbi:MAG TPA: hypothetical protein VL147_05255 [Devosia sp.]|uniref:hypothetical protein n=1 Tax=Pararhizobium sp. TaxID=1977563 RepID=UPI002CDC40D6|nr:hypothetical protein [Pararhizobium sp.]HTN60945.1 hypothetical protein [Devosia sp.]HTO32591.1 hypothetical protein [Pararhizobium sp.]
MTFQVVEGSFGRGSGSYANGVFRLPKRAGWGVEEVPVSRVVSAELASEENVRKLSGTLGWGAVGGLALGPVGLLAGLLLGGKATVYAFIVVFDDGRSFLATGDHQSWLAIKGAALSGGAGGLGRVDLSVSIDTHCEDAAPVEAVGRSRRPPHSDARGFVENALIEAGWDPYEWPKVGFERFTIFDASRGRQSLVLGYTAETLTDHLLGLMSRKFDEVPDATIRLVVSKAPGGSVEKLAKQMGLKLAEPSALRSVLP